MDEDVGKDDMCASGTINAEHCGMLQQPGQNNYKMWLYDNQKEKKELARYWYPPDTRNKIYIQKHIVIRKRCSININS